MGFNNKRQPFPFRNGGNPSPMSLGPGVPQFSDNDVLMTVNIQVDKNGILKLTAMDKTVGNGMPHPLKLVKLFTGLIQGQADFLLMQDSMIIKTGPTNDGTTKTGEETGEPQTADDHRGNPTRSN